MSDDVRRCPEYGCRLRDGHGGDHMSGHEHGRAVEIACRGKRRYTSEKFALTVAADCFARRGTWLRVYGCDECSGFHLTHQNAMPKPGWRPPEPSRRESAHRRRRDELERRDRRRRR